MRILKELSHPSYQVSVFISNEKYIIRVADAGIAVDFKIPEGIADNAEEAEEWAESGLLEKVGIHLKNLHQLSDKLSAEFIKSQDDDELPEII